ATGRVYVGSLRDDPFSVGGERKAGEAYRIDPDGTATQIYGDVGLANGIGFSPDGRRIYQSDSAIQSILVHHLDDLGYVDATSRQVFARVKGGVPDGLVVDTEGGVWVAVFGGSRVDRYAPDGTLDRSITVPAESVTSLVFFGPQLADLIVVTADNSEHPEREGTVLLVPAEEVGARGLPAPLARV
ncbi:MAG TPA: SMP-30/gluconolactonase/LRE family protein, partial [Acidimicrobiales bacterium]|nr:SMP-30/gluconolactonase/LRE family protein [Acidimicrobiales bacterium]